MEEIVLKPRPPYMISLHLRMFTLPDRPTPCIFENSCCRRMVGGIVFETCISGEPDNPLLRVKLYRGDPLRARAVVEHIYNIGLDYQGFLECIKDYEPIYDIALKYRGLRPAFSPSLYEAVVKSIINQNIPMGFALRITSRLVEKYGRKTMIDGRLFYDFPEPAKLASTSINELRALGLSRRKAEYIIGLSKEVAGGYDLESLRKLEPAEAVEELVKFKGIGPWTAKLSLMATTGNLSLDLLEDKAVSKGLVLLGIRERVRDILDRCRRYVGLIMYLSALSVEHGV